MIVSLGGSLEVEEDLLLAEPGPPIEDAGLRAAVQAADAAGWGESFEASGTWRVLRDRGAHVDVGAWSDTWDGWVTMRLERRRGAWEVTGSAFGQQVGPSRATRTAGLSLVWPDPVLQVRRGQRWSLHVRVVNGRDERVRDVVSPYCLGHLERDGVALPVREHVGVPARGRVLDLTPGATADLDVLLTTGAPERLPAGRYLLRASWLELDLEAPPVEVDVR